jgi:hypothetical protein
MGGARLLDVVLQLCPQLLQLLCILRGAVHVLSVRVVRIIARPLRRGWVCRLSRHDVGGLSTGTPSTGIWFSCDETNTECAIAGSSLDPRAALFNDRREFDSARRGEEKVEIGLLRRRVREMVVAVEWGASYGMYVL